MHSVLARSRKGCYECGVPRPLLPFVAIFCGCLLAGCQGGGKKVDPQFGLRTLTMVGMIQFERGGAVERGDVFIRREEPGKFELVAKKSDQPWARLLADQEDWQIEFAGKSTPQRGHGTPGDEELALWVETHRMVVMAIKKAQFTEDFTQTMRGDYESGGRHWVIDLGDFRHVVGQVFATKMRLTCKGCKSALQIEIRQLM